MNLSRYSKEPTVEERDLLIVQVFEARGYKFPKDAIIENKEGWDAFGEAIEAVKEIWPDSPDN